jgi:hypothetical protein
MRRDEYIVIKIIKLTVLLIASASVLEISITINLDD